jgi:hypothetical protein
MVEFEVLYHQLPAGTEDNCEKPQRVQLVSWLTFKPVTS